MFSQLIMNYLCLDHRDNSFCECGIGYTDIYDICLPITFRWSVRSWWGLFKIHVPYAMKVITELIRVCYNWIIISVSYCWWPTFSNTSRGKVPLLVLDDCQSRKVFEWYIQFELFCLLINFIIVYNVYKYKHATPTVDHWQFWLYSLGTYWVLI